MRKAIWFLLFLAPCFVQAQNQETLTGHARVKGGFGGPFFTYSTVGDISGGGAGGGGGVIIDNLFFGAFGQGEYFGKVVYENRDYDLSLGYGGLWIGYVVPSHKLVHLYTSVKIAGGGAIMSEHDHDDFDFDDDVDFSDGAFVVHPEAGIELNVAHWCRMSAVGGYRFMNGVSRLPTFDSSDFDSPTFSVVLRFGGFGYRRN